MLNITQRKFEKIHKKKQNQILYLSFKTDGNKEILNLIDNFLIDNNSFIFESVEKGKIKGRYTIFGKNPDKIWEFNNNNCYLYRKNKKKKIKGSHKKNKEKIIQNFNFPINKKLPPISSILAGYFSYDVIRYIEKIPNSCNDDLGIPDTRIIKPKILIVHDNLKKEIYYLYNCFSDEKINSYIKKYESIENELENLIFLSNYKSELSTVKKKHK